MLYVKQKRFNEFLNSIEEINPKTLSIRLKEMEKDGLIKRHVYNETPIRIDILSYSKGQRTTTNNGTDGVVFGQILLRSNI